MYILSFEELKMDLVPGMSGLFFVFAVASLALFIHAKDVNIKRQEMNTEESMDSSKSMSAIVSRDIKMKKRVFRIRLVATICSAMSVISVYLGIISLLSI